MFTKTVNLVVAVLLTFLPVSSPCVDTGSIVCGCHRAEASSNDDAKADDRAPTCCHKHAQHKRHESSPDQHDGPPHCPNCDHEVIKSLKSTAPGNLQVVVNERGFASTVNVYYALPAPFIYSAVPAPCLDRPPGLSQIPPPMSVITARVHRLLI